MTAFKKELSTYIACLTGSLALLFIVCSCASPSPGVESSNHYVTQVPQVYPCPECNFSIPTEKINTNIRTKNECPNCGAKFPYLESSRSDGDKNYQQGKNYQGPKIFGRGYYRDIKYNNKVEHSVKNNWKVNDDGNSGSMSQTFIRSYEHIVDGEYGTLVGPGAYYGYGGYGD